MARVGFSIPKYRDRTPVWGYALSKEEVAQQVGYGGITVMDEEASLEAGHYFDGLVFGSLTLQQQGTVKKDLKLPNAIIDVTQSHNIVKTPLIIKKESGANQLRGTFKEMMSMGDSQVSISGVLVSPKGSLKRPNAQMDHLVAFHELGLAINVSNETLYHLNIFRLVIESIQWLPFQYINTQPFRLTCSSDDQNLYKLEKSNG